MKADKNFYLLNLGCPKNQVDGDYIRGTLSNLGFDELANPEQADYLIVNTCAFIDQARQETRGEITELPSELEEYVFGVDVIVGEGDTIDLGDGMVWTVYETPGHSPCHLSLLNETEGTLVIGDATGFYDTEKKIFWPNYFESLEKYCSSILKLSNLSARRIALSHNGVIEGGLTDHFQRAIRATEIYHLEMLERLAKGEDPDEIALERAKWVTTFTALVPFETIQGLNRLLVRCSQSAVDQGISFTISG